MIHMQEGYHGHILDEGQRNQGTIGQHLWSQLRDVTIF